MSERPDNLAAGRPTCDECGFDLWIPVAELEVSHVGFYDDARTPGRCLVSLRDHYDHLDDVPAEMAAAFMRDVQAVGAALRALGSPRINYAVLGNEVAHVHAHVIPRYEFDPVFSRPIWEHPEPKRKNTPAEKIRLVEFLKATLEHGRPA